MFKFYTVNTITKAIVASSAACLLMTELAYTAEIDLFDLGEDAVNSTATVNSAKTEASIESKLNAIDNGQKAVNAVVDEKKIVVEQTEPVVEKAQVPVEPEIEKPVAKKSLEEQAKEALTKNDGVSSKTNLEEVFEATDEKYQKKRRGKFSLNYSFSYAYARNDRIDTIFDSASDVQAVVVRPNASHSFGNTFSLGYGINNSLSASLSVPFTYRINALREIDTAGLGDVSLGLRWSPFKARAGAPNTSFFASFSPPTGDSPFKIDANRSLATGKGYNSLTLGASVSKYLDPAIVFASLSYNVNSDVTGIDQGGSPDGTTVNTQNNRKLKELRPGDSFGLGLGVSYSITYDLSLSLSASLSYGLSSEYTYQDFSLNANGQDLVVHSGHSMNASVNSSFGLRVSPKRIVNFNFGFGLTEDASDVNLGVSMPINFDGMK